MSSYGLTGGNPSIQLSLESVKKKLESSPLGRPKRRLGAFVPKQTHEDKKGLTSQKKPNSFFPLPSFFIFFSMFSFFERNAPSLLFRRGVTAG